LSAVSAKQESGSTSPDLGLTARGRRKRFAWAAAALAVLLLATGVGVLGYLTWSNYERADRWRDRSLTLQRNVRSLNELLVVRSRSLNARTRELNAMAAKVRRTNNALLRSEQDVTSLARRQRELANEKAQVEDARAELAAESAKLGAVADAFIDCKNGLVEVLEYVAVDDYASLEYVIPEVRDDCQSAEFQLSDYNAVYGR
jgi:hypothetical protein